MQKLLILTLLFYVLGAVHAKEYVFLGQDYEPFNWLNNGRVQGGMVDVVTAACRKIKVRCSFKILPMKRVISQLQDADGDGALSLIYNKERESFLTLSTPIIKSNMSLHAIRHTFLPTTVKESFIGANIGATATSSAATFAESIKGSVKSVTIEYETGLPVVLKKLSAGRYGKHGVGIANEDVARRYMEKIGIKNIIPVYVAEAGRFGVAFSKKNVDQKFITLFNETINEMKKNGELKNILQHYGLTPDLEHR